MSANNRVKSNIIDQVRDAIDRVNCRIHYYKNNHYNNPIMFQYLKIEDELLRYLDELLAERQSLCCDCGRRLVAYLSNEWTSSNDREWKKVGVTRLVCILCGQHFGTKIK